MFSHFCLAVKVKWQVYFNQFKRNSIVIKSSTRRFNNFIINPLWPEWTNSSSQNFSLHSDIIKQIDWKLQLHYNEILHNIKIILILGRYRTFRSHIINLENNNVFILQISYLWIFKQYKIKRKMKFLLFIIQVIKG